MRASAGIGVAVGRARTTRETGPLAGGNLIAGYSLTYRRGLQGR
jgi:hypothetical protein